MSGFSAQPSNGVDADLGLASRAAALRQNFDGSFAEPRQAASGMREDFLAVRLEAEFYAIRLSEITGLFANKKITQIPGQGAALRGIAGFRGVMVPVYDLRVLMGYKAAEEPRWLIRVPSIALAFDRLDGHLRVEAREIVSQAKGERAQHHVQEFLTTQDRVWPIVRIASLLDAIRSQTARPAPDV
jgi:chemotaxis signal transduction protein